MRSGRSRRRLVIGLGLLGDVHVCAKDMVRELLWRKITSLLIYTNPRVVIWSHELVGIAQRFYGNPLNTSNSK